MRTPIAVAVTLLALPLVASAPPVEARTSAPVAAAAAPVVLTDIAYAPAQPPDSRGHLLDLYLPLEGSRRPLLIWTGGSGWLADNGKDSAGPIADFFTAKGYAVAGVSIRSSGQAVFPAQVFDIKAAVRWLRAHAHQYGLDPTRFAIMGDSSGGWTTAMATLTGGVHALEGNVGERKGSSRVQAGVAFFPPTDFLQMNSEMIPGACDFFNLIFGLTTCHDDPLSPESRLVGCQIQTCPRSVAPTDPVNYVDRNDPPIMILHGQADRLVPHAQSILLYNAIRANCGRAEFFSVPGADHSYPQILDPARHDAQTVYQTEGCREHITVGSPDPTFDTIESFLHEALRLGTAP
jgi:acetyl esterase/lipase